MKVIYIISLGHSGSTLIDCILGTHPTFHSSGELRYLNWQLERTKNSLATLKTQNICTCGNDFRNCNFWSKVFKVLKQKTGSDIVNNPRSFDTAYFKQFAYKDRGGFNRSFINKVKAYTTREWCELGWSYRRLLWLEPKLNRWLYNNWILYESMAEVGNKPIIVDSSKHLLIALLLQQYKPKEVTLLFLHRSIEGLISSAKRRATEKEQDYNIQEGIKTKKKFEKRIVKYKKNVPDLSYIDAFYEDVVAHPASFLNKIVYKTGASQDYQRQKDKKFYIDPSNLHLVAGNPMRYKGKMQVKYEDSWKENLTANEKDLINRLYYK